MKLSRSFLFAALAATTFAACLLAEALHPEPSEPPSREWPAEDQGFILRFEDPDIIWVESTDTLVVCG